MNEPTPIQTIDELRQLYGECHPHIPYKIQDHLTEQAQNFIRRSPFVLLSTTNAAGEPTISPKGGEVGFVGIEAPHTLYLPDQRGNKLIFSLQNILVNPQVGLIFLVPGTCETLRVHGQALLTADEALCQQHAVGNRAAMVVTQIKVTSAYFHCSRALKSSNIWQPESWDEKISISFKDEILPNLPDSEKSNA